MNMMTVEELYNLGDISEIGYIIMRLRFDYDSKYGSFGCFTNIMNKINQFTPEIVDYSYNSFSVSYSVYYSKKYYDT